MNDIIGKTITQVIRPDGDYLDTGDPKRMILVFSDNTRLHLNPFTDVHEEHHIEAVLEDASGNLLA